MEYLELRRALMSFREVFNKKLLPPSIVRLSKDFLKDVVDKNEWSKNEAFRVYNIIKPYKSKLKEVGYDFSLVPIVTMGKPAMVEYTRRVNGDAKSISIKGNVFIIRFVYQKALVDKIRMIPGRKYKTDLRLWEVPITESDQVKQFAMGSDFVLSDGAERMFNNIEDNFEASYNSEAVDLGFDLKLPLYPFQSAGADYGIKNMHIILADEMGLGKTVQGIAMAEGLNSFPCICIVPKSLRYNWVDEWAKWTNRKVIIADKRSMKQIKQLVTYGYCEVLIVNYEGIESFFTKEIQEVLQPSDGEINEGSTIKINGVGFPGYDRNNPKHKKFKVVERRPIHVVIKDPVSKRHQLVQINDVERVRSFKRPIMNEHMKLFRGAILDEGHECRNRKTMRFKTISKVFKDKIMSVIMTGTPVVNGPQDLGALLEIIGQIDKFGGSYRFNKDFGELTKVGLNSEQVKLPQELKELNIKLRSLCFIRREKHQVLKELPDKTRQIIRVDIDNRLEYDKAMKSLQGYLISKNVNPSAISRAMRAEMLVQINILKQISARGKLSAFKEFVTEVLNGGEKLIVFVWHLDIARFIKKNFENVIGITGDESDEDVHENKKKFMDDPKYKIIVATYKRGGVGHNLTAASKVAMIEQGWTYKDDSQAEDRAHRIGQEYPVNIYKFLGRNTIDEAIYNIIDAKRRIEKATTGGTSEVDTKTFSALAEMLMKPDNQT